MFLTTLLTTTLSALTLAQSDIPLSPALTNILSNAFQPPLYTYPTHLTQGIIPKALHSHNDYWRPLPFYSALSAGAISIEADVWLSSNSTLHVGHEESALTPQRTLDALYIQPILDVLRRQNPSNTSFVPAAEQTTKNGVFDTSAAQTLYLYIDMKTPGPATFPHVHRALAPLRRAGYLTTFNGSAVVPGPVTVIGTGNTPLASVQDLGRGRDIFYDAPVLSSYPANITANVSLTANAAFSAVFGEVRGRAFNATQARTLREQVQAAHERGLMVRYWDTPGWPVGTRNAVWRLLWEGAVDLVNVDDLEGASGFWEGTTG